MPDNEPVQETEFHWPQTQLSRRNFLRLSVSSAVAALAPACTPRVILPKGCGWVHLRKTETDDPNKFVVALPTRLIAGTEAVQYTPEYWAFVLKRGNMPYASFTAPAGTVLEVPEGANFTDFMWCSSLTDAQTVAERLRDSYVPEVGQEIRNQGDYATYYQTH